MDRTLAHNLTAQILASFCTSGILASFSHGGKPIATDDANKLGTFLGDTYQTLFARIVEADRQSDPAQVTKVERVIVDPRAEDQTS